MMKEITVAELKAKIDNKEDFQLVDVRETNEFEICSLGGVEVPMSELMSRFQEISKDKIVVVHCRSGQRSANVINALEQNHGYTNLYNLVGGILAWADEIDSDMETY
jgi:adenylyltransferase/sulfurtransferase